jgi:hypothetical protein
MIAEAWTLFAVACHLHLVAPFEKMPVTKRANKNTHHYASFELVILLRTEGVTLFRRSDERRTTL